MTVNPLKSLRCQLFFQLQALVLVLVWVDMLVWLHVPTGFAYLPGAEHYYKVELDPSDEGVRLWLEGSKRLPGCSIDKIDIHLENSIRYRDIPDVHVGARRLKIECHGVHDLDTVNGILK